MPWWSMDAWRCRCKNLAGNGKEVGIGEDVRSDWDGVQWPQVISACDLDWVSTRKRVHAQPVYGVSEHLDANTTQTCKHNLYMVSANVLTLNPKPRAHFCTQPVYGVSERLDAPPAHSSNHAREDRDILHHRTARLCLAQPATFIDRLPLRADG